MDSNENRMSYFSIVLLYLKFSYFPVYTEQNVYMYIDIVLTELHYTNKQYKPKKWHKFAPTHAIRIIMYGLVFVCVFSCFSKNVHWNTQSNGNDCAHSRLECCVCSVVWIFAVIQIAKTEDKGSREMNETGSCKHFKHQNAVARYQHTNLSNFVFALYIALRLCPIYRMPQKEGKTQ